MMKDAVSPVIGIILMVTITVIFSALIAAFVFGMTAHEEKNITVIDKTIRGGDYGYIFTDGINEYRTNWVSYRKLELNHTYHFINTCPGCKNPTYILNKTNIDERGLNEPA